jgi:hypothetical protein
MIQSFKSQQSNQTYSTQVKKPKIKLAPKKTSELKYFSGKIENIKNNQLSSKAKPTNLNLIIGNKDRDFKQMFKNNKAKSKYQKYLFKQEKVKTKYPTLSDGRATNIMAGHATNDK